MKMTGVESVSKSELRAELARVRADFNLLMREIPLKADNTKTRIKGKVNRNFDDIDVLIDRLGV